MIASVVLITIGCLGVLPSLVGLIGLFVDGRLTWGRASSPLIALLCGSIFLAGGIMVYRRIRG